MAVELAKVSLWLHTFTVGAPLSFLNHHLRCGDHVVLLTGTPDYMFSRKSPLGKTVLEAPLVVIVEAKKNDFEQGWGQCLAELVAAQKINQDAERAVYGVVTDGNLWQFGRLRKNVFTRNAENFTVDRLARLYGALDCVAELVEQEDLR